MIVRTAQCPGFDNVDNCALFPPIWAHVVTLRKLRADRSVVRGVWVVTWLLQHRVTRICTWSDAVAQSDWGNRPELGENAQVWNQRLTRMQELQSRKSWEPEGWETAKSAMPTFDFSTPEFLNGDFYRTAPRFASTTDPSLPSLRHQ